jgi:hypothetical protein
MEPTPFIFDTGASVPVLNLDYYLDHIDPKAQVPKPKEGQPKALPFMMKSLAIGGLTFRQVFSVALDLSFIFEIGKMHYPGIIGASVLQASIVHREKVNKLNIRPIPKSPFAFHENMLLITIPDKRRANWLMPIGGRSTKDVTSISRNSLRSKVLSTAGKSGLG